MPGDVRRAKQVSFEMMERADMGNGNEDCEELFSIPDESDEVIANCNSGLTTTDGYAAELIVSMVQGIPFSSSREIPSPRPLISKRCVNYSRTYSFLEMMKASILQEQKNREYNRRQREEEYPRRQGEREESRKRLEEELTDERELSTRGC